MELLRRAVRGQLLGRSCRFRMLQSCCVLWVAGRVAFLPKAIVQNHLTNDIHVVRFWPHRLHALPRELLSVVFRSYAPLLLLLFSIREFTVS